MRRIPKVYRNQWRAAKKLSKAARIINYSYSEYRSEEYDLTRVGIDKEIAQELRGMSKRLKMLSSQLNGLDAQGCPRDE